MAKRQGNQDFGRGGVIICAGCGKRTRDTGHSEGVFGMCRRCIQDQEWANGITDGTYTLEDVPADRREGVKKFL